MGPAVGFSAVATVLAGVVAYGPHPAWAQFRYGLDLILLSRQLQWPFIVLSLFAAIALLGSIIAGRRSAWWLIGLTPVLALFGHRFATDPTARMAAVENPTFVAAEDAGSFLDGEDFVVGLTLEGKHYAYSYAALYSTPAVIHAQHDRRVLVMWSAPANRALAFFVNREIRARDLDIVSTPANALLVYDTSEGTFINGLTGQTTDGQKPKGFLNPVPTTKTQWWKWRVKHPDTLAMVPIGTLAASAPRQPMRPVYPMPTIDPKHPADAKLVVVGTQRPAAVLSASVGAAPLNLSADGQPVLVFRESLTGVVRGFARKVDDLSPRFRPNRDPARKDVAFIDSDTNSGWSAAGVAIEAKKEFRGKRLPVVPVEDELYWGVMKFWYPELEISDSGAGVSVKVIELNGAGTGASTQPAQTVGESGSTLIRPSRPARPVKKKP